jgi:hypothetical protein
MNLLHSKDVRNRTKCRKNGLLANSMRLGMAT